MVQVSENTFPSWACHTSSAVQVPKKKKNKLKKKNTNTYHLRQFYICTPAVQFEKLDVAMEVSQSQQLLTLEDSHDAIA